MVIKDLNNDGTLYEIDTKGIKEVHLASQDGWGLATEIKNPRMLANLLSQGTILIDIRGGDAENDIRCRYEIEKIIVRKIK